MATEADKLQTALNQIADRIVEVTASANPDYSVGGRTISKASYLAQLVQQQESLRKALVRAAGPWQSTSKGIT